MKVKEKQIRLRTAILLFLVLAGTYGLSLYSILANPSANSITTVEVWSDSIQTPNITAGQYYVQDPSDGSLLNRTESMLYGFVKGASVIVFKSGSMIYAINGTVGTEITHGTDLSAVIESTLSGLPGRGCKILIQAGTYSMTTQLNVVDQHVTIEGEGHGSQSVGWGTVLRKMFNGDLIKINYTVETTSGFHIKNLMIQGNSDTYSGRGIVVDNAKGWSLEGLSLYKFKGAAIWAKDCGYHYLRDVYISEIKDEHMIYYDNCIDWKWFNVEAWNIKSGTQQYDAVYITASSGEIIGGHFESGLIYGRHGIDILDSQITIVEARILACGTHGIQLYNCPGPVKLIGISIWNVNETGININNSYNVTVMACSVEDRRASVELDYGLREYGSSDYNTVIGSTFKNAQTSNITIIGLNSHVGLCWNGTDWISTYP